MSQITRIEMWRDVGFQEGAVEVPSKDDHLALLEHSDDELGYLRIEYEDGIRTSTEDFFSAFTIPKAFSDDILSYSYLRVTYSYNNVDSPQTFYGWIDDVALKSDTDGNPAIRVTWHIDMWRSYFSRAHFGYGLVNRRPRSVFQPPQPVNAVIPTASEAVPLINQRYFWAIINVTYEDTTHTLTSMRTFIYPVDPQNFHTSVTFRLTSDTQSYSAPTFGQTVQGSYDEALGLDPDSIHSAFITPVCPWGEPYSTDGGIVTLFGGSGSSEELTGHFSTAEFPYYKNIYGDHKRHPTAKGTLTSEATVEDDWNRLISNHDAYGAVRCRLRDWLHPTFPWDQPYETNYLVAVMKDSSFGDEIARSSDDTPIVVIPVSALMNHTGALTRNNVTFGNVLGYCDRYEWSYREDSDGNYPKEAIERLVVYGWRSASDQRSITVDPHATGFIVAHAKPDDITWRMLSSGVSTFDVSADTVPEKKSFLYSRTGYYPSYHVPLSNLFSDDTVVTHITGFDGFPVYTLPWGRSVDDAEVTTVISSASVYIRFRFNGRNSPAEGMEVTVPVPSVPVTTNSWSSYVFSGARDADIAQRKAEAQSALVSGIASSVTGGMSNAVFASIGTYRKGQPERWQIDDINEQGEREPYWTTSRPHDEYMYVLQHVPASKSKGIKAGTAGAASIGAGTATSLIEYGLTTRMNGILQGITDQATARQADTITQDTSGMDWYYNCDWLCAVRVTADHYSLDRWRTDQELNGCTVSEAVPDCTSLISDGGPLLISELIVTGPVPPRARAYLRGRFANGVRIKTINQPEDTTDAGAAGPAPDITIRGE